MEKGPSKVRIYDKASALAIAEAFCAYQERSQQEVRNKLFKSGVDAELIEEVLIDLIEDGFLNEERFALTYAGGKFRVKGWGRTKIKQGLRFKGVSDYCIRKALAQFNDKEYHERLQKLIGAKHQSIKENNAFRKNHKTAQYAISRGFEPELVWEIIRKNFPV